MDAKNLADLYELPLVEWQRIEEVLAGDPNNIAGPGKDDGRSWLGTVNADGTPHLTGIGPMWHDGGFFFTSGEGARKARNLARDGRCTLGISTAGFDLSVDGEAALIEDPAVVADVAARYAASGWPVTAEGTGLTAPFSAPSAGPPPWQVYRFTPREATAVLTTEPGGATRWRF